MICAGADGIFNVLSMKRLRVGYKMESSNVMISSTYEIATNICHAAKLAGLVDLPIETKVDDCTIAILKVSMKTSPVVDT